MIRYIIIFVLFGTISANSKAQVSDTLSLERIVVTASKVETTERLTTKVVDVVSFQEIQQSGANDLSQLLQLQNGLLINGANSNPGKDKAVYLRGAGTQYTVILLNGYPISDPSSEGGAFDLRLLPLSNVERIEIVKGSMSTLYGSDAIAGVINIITKKPTAEGYSVYGRVGFGSFNDQNYELGLSGTASGIGYSISGAVRNIDGISDAEIPADGADFDDDGFRKTNLSANFDIPLSQKISILPSFNYGNFDGQYDNGAFTDGANEYTADFLNIGTRFEYSGDDLVVKGGLKFTDTEREFVDDFGSFNPEAQLLNSDVFGYYTLEGGHRMLAGLNYQKLSYQLDATDADNNLISPYLSTTMFTDFGLSGEVGLRFNQHSEFGSNLSYNIAPVYNVSEHIKLLVSYSTGFKSPTLNEMFGPFGSNPDLKPQKSATFDLGGSFSFLDRALNVQVTYFNRTVDDLILYSNITFGYINADEQHDRGVELSIDWLNPFFELSTFYNYLDGTRKTPVGDVDNLLRRPSHSFGFNATKVIEDKLLVNVSGEFIGERSDQFFNPATFTSSEVSLDSYTLFNLRTSYQFDQFSLYGDLKNIFDTNYNEVYGFTTPGRNFNIGLRFEI